MILELTFSPLASEAVQEADAHASQTGPYNSCARSQNCPGACAPGNATGKAASVITLGTGLSLAKTWRDHERYCLSLPASGAIVP